LSGRTTPAYRDIATTQRPARALAARLDGAHLDPYASFGQAYWGNPNLLLVYPFPASPRFLGLHLLLHLGLGLFGAFLFLNTEVRSREAALDGGVRLRPFGLRPVFGGVPERDDDDRVDAMAAFRRRTSADGGGTAGPPPRGR